MFRSKDVILQLYAHADAPLRDYYGLLVTSEKILLNIWNITHGRHSYPKQWKCDVENFENDKRLQEEIERIFGTYALVFLIGLSKNQYNLQFLPTKIFLKILKYLSSRDIIHLSQTSKILFQRCSSDFVWKLLYKKLIANNLTFKETNLAADLGWKKVFNMKMLSRNKHKHGNFKSRESKTLNNVKIERPTSTTKRTPVINKFNNLTPKDEKNRSAQLKLDRISKMKEHKPTPVGSNRVINNTLEHLIMESGNKKAFYASSLRVDSQTTLDPIDAPFLEVDKVLKNVPKHLKPAKQIDSKITQEKPLVQKQNSVGKKSNNFSIEDIINMAEMNPPPLPQTLKIPKTIQNISLRTTNTRSNSTTKLPAINPKYRNVQSKYLQSTSVSSIAKTSIAKTRIGSGIQKRIISQSVIDITTSNVKVALQPRRNLKFNT